MTADRSSSPTAKGPVTLGVPEGPVTLRVPEGDDRMRKVCDDCGFIFYENPKLIVGAVCSWTNDAGEDLILLIRRAIEPRVGFWSIPAGYMELNETSEAGAVREVWEEARARVVPDALLAVYNLPQISQVHLIYRAKMNSPHHGAGPESIETGLFRWDEIPWDELAYPNVRWMLESWRDLRGQTAFSPAMGPVVG